MIVFHAPRDLSGDDAATTDAFEAGFVDGLKSGEAELSGIEETDTEPSQIQWFKDRGLPSVDNVDTLSGHAALVFVLLGANGSYGEKDSAQALLPNSDRRVATCDGAAAHRLGARRGGRGPRAAARAGREPPGAGELPRRHPALPGGHGDRRRRGARRRAARADPGAGIADDVLRPELRTVAIYAFGVAGLGLVDDALGGAPRGWRGHGAAALRGSISTGALKAAGSLGLALYALSGLGYSDGEYLLATGVLVLFTNLFNLLDLRPGRSVKAFALLGAGLTLGAWDVDPLWALGLFAGAVLVVGLYDLRERAMLGDTGSNLIGGAGRPVGRARAGHHGPGDRSRRGAGDHDLWGVSVNLRARGAGSAAPAARLVRQTCMSPDSAPQDALHLRHRRRRLLSGEGHRGGLDRPAARGARPERPAPEVRPVHQRRPGHDVARTSTARSS